MLKNQISSYYKFCLASGVSTLLLYCSIFTVSCLLLIAGLPVSAIHFFAGIIVWLLLTRLFLKEFDISLKMYWVAAGSTLILLAVTGYMLSMVLDTYYDSQWYHMDAVIQLANGWNPYHQVLSGNDSFGLYLNYFPKATWIVEANLFKLSGSLEASKCTTFFLMISVFFFSNYLFGALLKLRWGTSILFSLLLAANPVSLLSSFSFYVDGQVSALFILVCAFAVSYFITQKSAYLYLALISNQLLAHCKVMASVYAFILFAAIFICAWLFKTGNIKHVFLKIAAAGIITYVIIGFHPFISNWTMKGHPLYPAMGTDELTKLMEESYPSNFEGKNTIERFGLSLIGKPQWSFKPYSIEVKKMFGDTPTYYYGNGVMESGAWGPILPEILILMLPVFVLALVFHYKQKITWYIAGSVLFILLTVFINPEAWLARYVPQFWLAVICMLFLLFQFKIFKIFGGIFTVLLLLNIYQMGNAYMNTAIDRSNKQKEILQYLSIRQKEYDIDYGWARSVKYRFWKYGIDTSQFVKFNRSDTNCISIERAMSAAYRLKSLRQKR